MENVVNRRPRSLYAMFSMSVLALLVLFSACAGSGTPTSTPAAKGNVSVLYAGSLVNIMEHQVGPAFDKATGYTFQGEGKGSVALANEIAGKLRTPDIFISAGARVNTRLMGPTNGNYVSWYINMARTELVIGYNPQSQFVSDFKAAANGSKQWYQVLEEPGVRFGRNDPLLGPKGYNTLFLFQLAQQYYHQPDLMQKILGSSQNASLVFPEEQEVARLSSGQLDAGVFYINEMKQQKLPFISLPAQINLGDPTLASDYAQAKWTNPKTHEVVTGAPVIYTITIPSTSKNHNGAIAFANFMLSAQGQSILKEDGVLSTPIKAVGDTGSIPQQLLQYIQS